MYTCRKDYETNKLVSGVLQLAPHTHLVLDETRLQQGKLEANGVHAVQHLAHLINNQELKCDLSGQDHTTRDAIQPSGRMATANLISQFVAAWRN